MHLKRKKDIFIVATCILVVLFASITGGVFSKYKETVTLSPVSLTVSGGHLADVFTLKEHNAVQNSDGTYSLGTSVVTANTYRVLPGLTVPKDPYFTIQGKSKIASYLFVEVVNSSSTDLSYTLNGNWMDLNLTGAKGGKVYVYTGGGNTAKILDQNFTTQQIFVLNNNQVTVSSVNKASLNVALSFHGYLAQVSLADTPSGVYTTCFGGGNS